MKDVNTLTINQRKIPFELRRSARAKRMSLKIETREPKVVLVVPRFTMNFQINMFIGRQETWIDKHWSKVEKQQASKPKLEHSEMYYKAKAKRLIRLRLLHFNHHYQLKYNRIFFRNQKTRWGSCSSKKNLNFNWRLILAPQEILDYVVAHELCHLKYMNHSKSFWNMVEEQIPDYKKRRKWLKDNHYLLS